MKVLTFKDELAGETVKEFCGLKPKLYSILAKGLVYLISKLRKKIN